MDYTTVSPKGDAFPLSVDCGELVHSFRRRFLSACAAWVVSLNRWVKQFVIFMRLVMTSTVTVCNTVSPTQLTNPSGCKQKPQSKKGCPCHRQAVSKIAPEKSLCASCCAVQKCKKTRENRRGLQLRSIYTSNVNLKLASCSPCVQMHLILVALWIITYLRVGPCSIRKSKNRFCSAGERDE